MRMLLVTLALLCAAVSAYQATWGKTTFASYSWSQLDTLGSAYAQAPGDSAFGASDVAREKRRRIGFPLAGALAVLLAVGAYFAPAGSNPFARGDPHEAARLASYLGGG